MRDFLTANTSKLLLVLGIVIVIFNAILLPAGTDGKIPLDLKFGYDLPQAMKVLSDLGQDTLPKYRFGLIVTDMAYPVIYACFFSLLLFRAWSPKFVLVIPILVMLLDIGENLSILTLVDTFPNLSESDVRLASNFSTAKWSMVIFTLLLIIVGFVRKRWTK